jgi:hypothetical protein
MSYCWKESAISKYKIILNQSASEQLSQHSAYRNRSHQNQLFRLPATSKVTIPGGAQQQVTGAARSKFNWTINF